MYRPRAEPATAAEQSCHRHRSASNRTVVTAPVTLGIVRPEIVLPADWRKWDAAKLEAVTGA